jgi:hypothetical protein
VTASYRHSVSNLGTAACVALTGPLHHTRQFAFHLQHSQMRKTCNPLSQSHKQHGATAYLCQQLWQRSMCRLQLVQCITHARRPVPTCAGKCASAATTLTQATCDWHLRTCVSSSGNAACVAFSWSSASHTPGCTRHPSAGGLLRSSTSPIRVPPAQQGRDQLLLIHKPTALIHISQPASQTASQPARQPASQPARRTHRQTDTQTDSNSVFIELKMSSTR